MPKNDVYITARPLSLIHKRIIGYSWTKYSSSYVIINIVPLHTAYANNWEKNPKLLNEKFKGA